MTDELHKADALMRLLDEIRMGMGDLRSDVARVEVIAREGRDQGKITNGRVTALEMWKIEVKGIAQGAGGAGRLLFYILSAAAGTGTLIVAAMKILGE